MKACTRWSHVARVRHRACNEGVHGARLQARRVLREGAFHERRVFRHAKTSAEGTPQKARCQSGRF